jgi:hypothetical protein
MATIFKNAIIKDVGTKPIEVFQVGQNKKNIVLGISLTNITDSTVLATVLISDEGSVTANYIKDVPIPPNTSLRALNGGEKLILDQYHRLSIQSSWGDSMDAVISFVEQV